MGCDIHMFCEQYKTINGKKRWINKDYWIKNPYFGTDDYEKEYSCVELHGGLDYSMFTALCGVRDYIEKSPMISPPKGLPDDCCDEIKLASAYWGSDGHSHSYVTLREVKGFLDKNEPVIYSGLISPEDAKALDEEGRHPTIWCQRTSDKTWVYREWKDDRRNPLQSLYESMVDRFLDRWEKIEELEPERLDNFRMVFWFDN